MKTMNYFTKPVFVLMIFLILVLNVISVENSFSFTDSIKIRPYADNTLYEDPIDTLSNGSGSYFFSGMTAGFLKRRGLVKFSFLDYIPPCAIVTRVTLRLHMSKTISGNKTVQLRKVLEDWGAGLSDAPDEEGYGTFAEPGDATWYNTFYNDQYWSSNGGVFANTVTASNSVGGVGYYTWGSNTQMVNDVQGWVDDPSSNFGWLVLGDESTNTTAKRFDTVENDSLNFRPLLTVVYSTNNSISLSIGTVIEGFWDGNTMVRDTMRVYLRNSVSPYARIDSGKTFLDFYGYGIICFRHAGTGTYYIEANHRNSITTWSKFPQLMTAGNFEFYDFTIAASQAYGDNEVLKLGPYCIYSGDVNKDGVVDLNDTQIIDNDANNFVSGYVQSDVNGDDFVDVADASIADNNSFNFVMEMRP